MVYPFGIPWDNNIAQRNVHIVRLEGGGKGGLSIHSGYPFDDNQEMRGSLHVVLTYSPPIIGRKVIPPEAAIVIDRRKKSSLKSWKDYLRMGGKFKPDLPKKPAEKPLAGTVFPDILYKPKSPHKIDIEVAVPKEVKAGSVYSLHIAQYIENTVTGGYTVVIKVK